MGIFGDDRKVKELLNKYNLQEISDDKDKCSVVNIAQNLVGNNLATISATLSGKAEEKAKLTYLSSLIEQNWIIIRQLDRLNKKLEDMK